MYTYRYVINQGPLGPSDRIKYGECDASRLIQSGFSDTKVKLLCKVLAYHEVERWDMRMMSPNWVRSALGWSNDCLLGEFEKLVIRHVAHYREPSKARYHMPRPHIDRAIEQMSADFDPSFTFLDKYFKETTDMSKNTNTASPTNPGSYSPATVTYDQTTGAAITTPGQYRSRILNGTELTPGTTYRLEIVGGKNPPEVAKAGASYKALADAYGKFAGDVLDVGSSCVFQTDATDLWLQA